MSDYLKDVVRKEEVTLFLATGAETNEETNVTVERVLVTEALQGYVEAEVSVYHEKYPDWNCLCNTGPSISTGVIQTVVASNQQS